MCGIVGMFGTHLGTIELKIFRQLLIVDALRGEDSVGIVQVDKDWNVKCSKSLRSPQDFLSKDATTKESPKRILIGHNRHATVGDVNIENAHPFTEDHITGVHNGTLKNHKLLSGGNKFEVDSRVLIYNIAKCGAEKTFSKVDGAYACVWWNSKRRSLNMIRNNQRPLHVHVEPYRYIWASEKEMLNLVLTRNNIKPNISSLEVDILYEFHFNSNGTVFKEVKTKVFKNIVKPKNEKPAPKAWWENHFNKPVISNAKRKTDCDWCGGYINETSRYKELDDGSVLCHICGSDEFLLRSLGIKEGEGSWKS